MKFQKVLPKTYHCNRCGKGIKERSSIKFWSMNAGHHYKNSGRKFIDARRADFCVRCFKVVWKRITNFDY